RRQWPGAAHIDIEAAMGCGDLDVERLVGRFQHIRERARRVQRTAEARIEDGTMLDRDNGVAARRGKADAQLAIAAAPRMNGDAAAAGAVGIDELVDLALNAVVRQGIDDNLPLPGAIGVHLPVLDGAAAAGSKIFAERRDALDAWLFDAE